MITGLGTAFYKEDLLKRFSCFLYKIAIKKNDHIFFQNKDDLNFFKKNKIFNNNNYQILPGSGIDLKHFKFRKFSKKKHNTNKINYQSKLYVERININF